MPRVSFSTQCWGAVLHSRWGLKGWWVAVNDCFSHQLKPLSSEYMQAKINVASHCIAQTYLSTSAIHQLCPPRPSPYPLSKSIRPDQSKFSPEHPWQVRAGPPPACPHPQKESLTEAPRPTIVPLFATGTAQAPCGFSPACRHAKDIRDTFCRHPITTTTRGRRRRHGPRPIPVSESDTGPAVCCFLQPFSAWPPDSPLCCRLLYFSSSTTRHRYQASQPDSMSKVCVQIAHHRLR